MTRCIVTYASGQHEELSRIAMPNLETFALKHGYTSLIVGDKLCDRPPAWNKIPLLIDALTRFDEALWFDADTIIVDTSKDIPFPKGDAVHAMVRHFSALSEVPNSGVWYLTKEALPLLEKIWELEVFWNHGWWEQAALLTLMGYSVPPEGSLFDSTKCRCVHETKWTRNCSFLRLEWNSHPNYRAARPRIVHCSYPCHKSRVEVMRRLVDDPEYNYPCRTNFV